MKDIVIAAALGLALSAQQIGQQATQQSTNAVVLPNAPSQQAPQKSQIPDAPKPQTSGIGPVTPGKGTTPTFNGQSGSGVVADPDQPDAGTPTKPLPDDTDTTAPATPANSQEFLKDPSVYTLGPLRVNSVEIPFTVKDSKGRLVPGLNWRDVQVYENNVRQHTVVFTVDPYPLSVALVIDQSLPIHAMASVNNSLGALQGAFTPYDEVAVFTYNNGPRMVTDFTGGQSARLSASIERSKSTGREQMYYAPGEGLGGGIRINGGAEDSEVLTRGPGSPQGVAAQQVPRELHTLNDAILMAAESVAKAEKGRRRIVYVISDGKEYGSTAKSKEVIKYLQTNKIEVVATLVGDSALSGMGFIDSVHLPLMMRDNILPLYAKATGGEFYADYRTKSIETSFAKITEDARTQYTIWYNSREPMIDGKYRNVDVRVLRPNLQVIAKKGYYPSVADQRPAVLMTPGKPVPVPAPPLRSNGGRLGKCAAGATRGGALGRG